jgi:hypothetical protein
MTSTYRAALLSLSLAAACTAAFAQNTGTTPNTNVGVSPSTGKEAMDKAVPRSDTATVTRTDESAADKARRAANATADAVTPGSATTGSSATTTGSGTTGPGMATGGTQTTRPSRADRG